MKVEKVSTSEVVGHILVHNVMGPEGRKLLKKGRVLQPEDVTMLQALGHREIYVAMLAATDIAENEAARRLGALMAGPYLQPLSATTGRVNLMAETAGVFKINLDALLAFNDVSGVTLATLPNNSQVEPKKLVGTVKIIPYGLPNSDLERAETVIIENAPIVEIRPFLMKQAILITTGSQGSQQKVIESFSPALRHRLTGYNVELIEGPFVAEDEVAISTALRQALASQVDMILIAGETSIMDQDDITPRAIKAVGGEVIHHGVPVEPGNLLLLAYWGQTPIVGAPGCARSKHYNVVDMVLPRLATGERLTRRDLIALGHGGYLQ
jgi:molybdopterin biosynthesis enzyme